MQAIVVDAGRTAAECASWITRFNGKLVADGTYTGIYFRPDTGGYPRVEPGADAASGPPTPVVVLGRCRPWPATRLVEVLRSLAPDVRAVPEPASDGTEACPSWTPRLEPFAEAVITTLARAHATGRYDSAELRTLLGDHARGHLSIATGTTHPWAEFDGPELDSLLPRVGPAGENGALATWLPRFAALAAVEPRPLHVVERDARRGKEHGWITIGFPSTLAIEIDVAEDGPRVIHMRGRDDTLAAPTEPDVVAILRALRDGGSDRVLLEASPAGLAYFDVNDATRRRKAREQVFSTAELGRHGSEARLRVMRSLDHLSHYLAMPYPQYSAIDSARHGDEIIVSVGVRVGVEHGYELRFRREGASWRLIRLAYLTLEGC